MTALQSTPSQHSYPPAASSSSHPCSPSSYPETISYLIHTETDGISDLRLQISHETSQSSSKPRPAYFRERTLNEYNEIVDSIIDASTGRTCWTIHRPTRGWYLYLRSPALPPNTAISISAPKDGAHDPSTTPLAFSLNTKVRVEVLSQLKPRISAPVLAATSTAGNQQHDHSDTTVEMETSAEMCPHVETATASGRENPKAGVNGHTRRRSGATGSGTHNPAATKRLSSAITKSPMIPEYDDNADDSPRNSIKPSRLRIPDRSASSQSPIGQDRPYSPTQPSPSSFSDSTTRTSTFLLTDGNPTGSAKSWTRWACALLPSEIRPSLAFDADKSFSLYWLDPPESTAAGKEGVEVVKFEDQSGRWMWNSATRGRLTLQTSAMQAVGLEKEFWITAALAYIQFLEDKDAYNAASDA